MYNFFGRHQRTAAPVKPERPLVADWSLKGDGVAYTTSKAILHSAAGQRMIESVKRLEKLARE